MITPPMKGLSRTVKVRLIPADGVGMLSAASVMKGPAGVLPTLNAPGVGLMVPSVIVGSSVVVTSRVGPR